MSYPHSPSYTTVQPSPSPSAPMTRSSPSPPPPSNSFHNYLPSLPIPVSPSSSHSNNHHHHNYNNNNHHHNTNHFQQRQTYPTSSPYNRHDPSPDPSPSSKSRLPPITSSFTNGYASPATSSYSSEPGSRDEIEDLSGSFGGSGFQGQHVNLPGVDGIMLRGDGMQLDNHGPRNDNRDRDYNRRWNMRDFTLVQTVGMYSKNTLVSL
jgi:hypothetical protein